MRRIRRLLTLISAIALLLATSSVVVAAQKEGCPSASSGWRVSTPEDAAHEFWPHLLPGQFASEAEFAAVIAANDDRDGDGTICIRRSWGEELNPNSNWYGVHALHVRDNTAAAQEGED